MFEKYDIDFCCKGERKPEEACIEKELNKAEVLAELNNAISSHLSAFDCGTLSISKQTCTSMYILKTLSFLQKLLHFTNGTNNS